MSIQHDWDFYLRLVAALFFGLIIGLERSRKGKAAGIRTHALVCLTSCLFMVISCLPTLGNDRDMMRIAAQVVSGVSFIGGSVIWMDRNNVKRGLTTAANIWMTSAVGMVIGYGYYDLAIVTGVLMFVAMNSHNWAIKLNLVPSEDSDDEE